MKRTTLETTETEPKAVLYLCPAIHRRCQGEGRLEQPGALSTRSLLGLGAPRVPSRAQPSRAAPRLSLIHI